MNSKVKLLIYKLAIAMQYFLLYTGSEYYIDSSFHVFSLPLLGLCIQKGKETGMSFFGFLQTLLKQEDFTGVHGTLLFYH